MNRDTTGMRPRSRPQGILPFADGHLDCPGLRFHHKRDLVRSAFIISEISSIRKNTGGEDRGKSGDGAPPAPCPLDARHLHCSNGPHVETRTRHGPLAVALSCSPLSLAVALSCIPTLNPCTWENTYRKHECNLPHKSRQTKNPPAPLPPPEKQFWSCLLSNLFAHFDVPISFPLPSPLPSCQSVRKLV